MFSKKMENMVTVILCMKCILCVDDMKSWMGTTGVVGLVIMGSFLRVWEVGVLNSNPITGSSWEIISCSRLMLINVLNGTRRIVMTHLNLLLPQAWPKWIECHYSRAQVKDANSGRPSLPIFCSSKKKKKNGWNVWTCIT